MAEDADSEVDMVSRPTFMLTTSDNPYDPFTQFDEWFQWDLLAGYGTSSLLARVALTSDEMSDADISLAIQQAIDTIVAENVSGVHVQVSRGDIKPA